MNNLDPVNVMRNLGPRSVEMLEEVGINNVGELKEAGYIDAYLSMKIRWPRHINRMALYALYGAFHDENCVKLSRETKDKIEKKLQKRMKEIKK